MASVGAESFGLRWRLVLKQSAPEKFSERDSSSGEKRGQGGRRDETEADIARTNGRLYRKESAKRCRPSKRKAMTTMAIRAAT